MQKLGRKWCILSILWYENFEIQAKWNYLKKILTYQIEKYCRLSLHWDTAEWFECLWGRTYTQTTTLYLLLSVKLGNPIHEIPFWKSDREYIEKVKRLNKAFSERGQLGSTENHLFVYEYSKLALCLRSLQRDIEWTSKH